MAVTVVEILNLKQQAGGWDILMEQIRFLRAAEEAGNGARATMGTRGKTVLDMAEVILKKAKKPLPSKDICAEIMKEYDVRVKPHSLGTMLYRSAMERKRTFFKDKHKPNTYGLLEWQ